jgi:polynucleotide 5'-hydroxyl-kinase GRC3/NOL9
MDGADTGSRTVEEVKDRILAHERCAVMVIGGSDTGKTTLIERLADLLAAVSPVAIVDADMGQSHIGPPTTIAWGLVKEQFPGWDSVEAADYYFVGATSPYRHLLPAVVGAKLICDAARSAAPYMIVDTTGLIIGSLGCVLKWSKIDAVQPDILVAVQKGCELETILTPYAHASSPLVVRMRPPQAVVSKSVDQRTAHRERMFARYFERSGVIELPAETVSIRCAEAAARPRQPDLLNRLVSLRNQAGMDIALGIVVEEDARGSSFLVRTPLKTVRNVSTIVIGDLCISPDGKQLGA